MNPAQSESETKGLLSADPETPVRPWYFYFGIICGLCSVLVFAGVVIFEIFYAGAKCDSCHFGDPDSSKWYLGPWRPCTCNQGWSGPCCNFPEGFFDGKFKVHRVNNDEVEHVMQYIKAPDSKPETLQGIWWMDQRGVHLKDIPARVRKGYKQNCRVAADELLVSWGEAEWQPNKGRFGCLGPVPPWGSSKAHWTYMDDGERGNPDRETARTAKLTNDFCCDNADCTDITLDPSVSLRSGVESVTGFDLLENVDLAQGYYHIPTSLVKFSMHRKEWGWDRKTVLGPDCLRSKYRSLCNMLLPGGLKAITEACHYPVFQIVDGYGNRTEHYTSYLEWANNDTTCEHKSFTCQKSRGNGTQLVWVLEHEHDREL